MEVEETRNRLGLPAEDIFGSLFFHVKNELVNFVERCRRFRLRFRVFALNMIGLPEAVDLVMKRPIVYDRIETSNMLDSLGPGPILSAWGPVLNRNNPHSTLLLHSLNWSIKVPNGDPKCLGDQRFQALGKELMDFLVRSTDGVSTRPSSPNTYLLPGY